LASWRAWLNTGHKQLAYNCLQDFVIHNCLQAINKGNSMPIFGKCSLK
jgi:hypothetical protein